MFTAKRIIPFVGVLAIGVLMYFFWPLRIPVAIFAFLMCFLELFAMFYREELSPKPYVMTIVQTLVVLVGLIRMIGATNRWFLLILIIVTVNDAMSAIVGSHLKNDKSAKRPFPKVSPNKTLIGYVVGYVTASLVGLLYAFIFYDGFAFSLAAMIVLGPAAAIAGDLLESYTKRLCGVKDSSDVLLHKEQRFPWIRKIEGLLGDHGGYLDRLDSFVMVFVFSAILNLIF